MYKTSNEYNNKILINQCRDRREITSLKLLEVVNNTGRFLLSIEQKIIAHR